MLHMLLMLRMRNKQKRSMSNMNVFCMNYCLPPGQKFIQTSVIKGLHSFYNDILNVAIQDSLILKTWRYIYHTLKMVL